MTIMVLLKRQAPEEKFDELKELIDQLRSATFGQPGYISGETLKRIDQTGECLVIAKWKSRADWERWFQIPKRADIQRKIDELLGTPTEYEIYEYQ
ncbi:MAG: antibiotic biosynthesis monooxygenase [Deltaproteobacteria bacterium]|nr:MAG: antibiotic biosynthesis monooxygenase [Deltaproteobacteria bacterium]